MTRTAVDAYPLAWPAGWKRAHVPRLYSRYKVGFTQARHGVLRAPDLMRGRDIVISTNVPLRRDGLPLATFSEPSDPGVAVYWTQGQPRVIACDYWRTVRENLRAIGIALEGIRSIDRSGATQILARAFVGFTALPASTTSPLRTWREVLGLTGRPSREVIDEAYRRCAGRAHPDAGGSHEQMVEVNRAREEALREQRG
jgi:hypothetical protein